MSQHFLEAFIDELDLQGFRPSTPTVQPIGEATLEPPKVFETTWGEFLDDRRIKSLYPYGTSVRITVEKL